MRGLISFLAVGTLFVSALANAHLGDGQITIEYE
jgi:hypothetical protein